MLFSRLHFLLSPYLFPSLPLFTVPPFPFLLRKSSVARRPSRQSCFPVLSLVGFCHLISANHPYHPPLLSFSSFSFLLPFPIPSCPSSPSVPPFPCPPSRGPVADSVADAAPRSVMASVLTLARETPRGNLVAELFFVFSFFFFSSCILRYPQPIKLTQTRLESYVLGSLLLSLSSFFFSLPLFLNSSFFLFPPKFFLFFFFSLNVSFLHFFPKFSLSFFSLLLSFLSSLLPFFLSSFP